MIALPREAFQRISPIEKNTIQRTPSSRASRNVPTGIDSGSLT